MSGVSKYHPNHWELLQLNPPRDKWRRSESCSKPKLTKPKILKPCQKTRAKWLPSLRSPRPLHLRSPARPNRRKFKPPFIHMCDPSSPSLYLLAVTQFPWRAVLSVLVADETDGEILRDRISQRRQRKSVAFAERGGEKGKKEKG